MAKYIGKLVETISFRFEQLADQEKKVVLILLSGLLFFLIGGGLFWLNYSANAKRLEISTIQKQLKEIHSLKPQYHQVKLKEEADEKRFKLNTISLFSLIQSVASRYSLTLYDLNEHKGKEPLSAFNLVETNVVVNLRQVSIDRLSAFLSALEDSSGSDVVKVIRLKIKTRFDTPDLLDAQMTVATWKPV